MNGHVFYDKKEDYQANYFTFIGNKTGPANKFFWDPGMLIWRTLDEDLSFWYIKWQGVEYKTISEGVFGPLN